MATFEEARDRAAQLVKRTGKAHLVMVTDLRSAAPFGVYTQRHAGWVCFDTDYRAWMANDIPDAIAWGEYIRKHGGLRHAR